MQNKPLALKHQRTCKESDILAAVRQWLDWQGYTAWRMPLGGVMQHGGRVLMRNPLKGFPDIAGLLKRRKGVFWACELKKKGGRVSDEQRAWHARLRDGEAEVWVAYSLPEFIERLSDAEKAG